MWRVMMALGLVLGITIVLTPQPVFACSCAMMSPREHLELADAAFVGTLISHEDDSSATSSADEITWTFQVEQVIKGEPGDEQVDVRSAVSGASCGFEIAVGQRVGVVLYERDGQWHGGLCGQIDPDALLAAGQPASAPDGEGPVALLLGNRGEDPRIIALDRQGRALGYGAGEGKVRSISVCPESERFIELVAYQDSDSHSVTVRDTRTLKPVNEYQLPDASMNVMTLYCRNPAGNDIIILEATQTPEWVSTNLIHRLQDGDLHTIYESDSVQKGGHQAAFDLEGNVAFLTAGYRGNDIIRVDLSTGDAVSLATVPAIEGEVDYVIGLALSPDRTRLAAVGYQPGPSAHFRILLIDLTANPVSVDEHKVGSGVSFGTVLWLDDDTFMVTTDDVVPGGAPIYNVALEQVGSIPDWMAWHAVRVDDTLYGLGWYGELIAAPLPDGPASTIRTFDNPNIFVMAGVPDEIEIDPGAIETPVVEPGPTPTVPPEPVNVRPPGQLGRWFGMGFLAIVIASGGWGVYRWRER